VFSLRNWYKDALMAKKKGKRPAAKQRPSSASSPDEETVEDRLERIERENAALKKENESLKEDREILKKAAAFFAKESE